MDGFDCLDCGTDTSLNDEYYMVHDWIWKAAVPDFDGMLCILCLEERIGYTLSGKDFTDAPVNNAEGWRHSPRLRNRLQ